MAAARTSSPFSPTLCLTAVLLSCAAASVQAQDAAVDAHDWSVHFDLQSSALSTAHVSWLDGGFGKLRYDESEDGLNIGRVFLQYDGRVMPTVFAHVVVDYIDDYSPGVDVTEAYLQWRPIPRSANRHELKAGFFYPRLSLENEGPGWSNSYAITNSAINTWIGEELRAFGAQWSVSRRIGGPGSAHEVSAHAAAYFGNDPAGTMLAWKGWGMHDRQTRADDALPLPALPQIGPGAMFDKQAPYADPFVETDDRPGYYFGGEWRYAQRVLVTASHYDNHADPLSLRGGQYGWTTVFDHVGLQLALPGEIGLVAQWMDGTTVMGPILDGARVVDTSFDARFVLLTRAFDKHRVTMRYDDFAVVDNDAIPMDKNDDAGDAWTLAWRYAHSGSLVFGAEWVEVNSVHPAAAYVGAPPAARERIFSLNLSYRYGS